MDFLFIFTRFSRFFSMNPSDVFDMPMRIFWAMNSQIERIQSEEDLRTVLVNQCTVNKDAAKKNIENLQKVKGEIYRRGGDAWFVEKEEGAHERLLALTSR